jgi:hypothetical protein
MPGAAMIPSTVIDNFEREQILPDTPQSKENHLLPSPHEHWTPRSDVTSTGGISFAVDQDDIVVDESQMTPEQLQQLEDEERRIDAAIRESEGLMEVRR